MEGEVSFNHFLLEAPKPDHPEKTGEAVKNERCCQDTHVAAGVVEPGSQGKRDEIREIPHKTQRCQSYHAFSRRTQDSPISPSRVCVSLPRGRVVSYKAVGHHDEGQESARDVLYREVDPEPDPPVHGVQVDTGEQVPHSSQCLACVIVQHSRSNTIWVQAV